MGVDAWLTEDQTHVVKIALSRLDKKHGGLAYSRRLQASRVALP